MSFSTSLFISDALASETAQNAAASQANFVSLVTFILILMIFYFLLIRPQQKKVKEHQNMVNNLKINDKVYTSGGILGVVKEINTKENQLEIEVAKGVIIKVVKSSISEVINAKEVDHLKKFKK